MWDLNKLSHHCPVTFSQFINHTNIMKLVRSGCSKNYGYYNDYLTYRANKKYLIYYIYPVYRLSDDILKQIVILPNCSESLKHKILQTPVIGKGNTEVSNNANDEQSAVHKPEGNNNNSVDNSVEGAKNDMVKNDSTTNACDIVSKQMDISKTYLNENAVPRRNENEYCCSRDTGISITPLHPSEFQKKLWIC